MRPLILLLVQAMATFGTLLSAKSWEVESVRWKVFAIVGAGVALFNAVYAWVTTVQLAAEKQKTDAQVILHALLTKLAEKERINAGDIGLHVFTVRRTLKAPLEKEQVRIARLRVSSDPPASGTRWIGKKGVIGACWEKGHSVVSFEGRMTHRQYIECSEGKWAKAPPKVTGGLSFREWEATRRYAYIAAVPIQNKKDGYVGCITIDTAKPELVGRLKANSVHGFLLDAAGAMSQILCGSN